MKLKMCYLEGNLALYENTTTPMWNACYELPDFLRSQVINQVLQAISLPFTTVTQIVEHEVVDTLYHHLT